MALHLLGRRTRDCKDAVNRIIEGSFFLEFQLIWLFDVINGRVDVIINGRKTRVKGVRFTHGPFRSTCSRLSHGPLLTERSELPDQSNLTELFETSEARDPNNLQVKLEYAKRTTRV